MRSTQASPVSKSGIRSYLRMVLMCLATCLALIGITILPSTSTQPAAAHAATTITTTAVYDRPAVPQSATSADVPISFREVNFAVYEPRLPIVTTNVDMTSQPVPMTPSPGVSCMEPAVENCLTLPGQLPGAIAEMQGLPSWTDFLAWNGIADPTRMPANTLMRLTPPPAPEPAPAPAPSESQIENVVHETTEAPAEAPAQPAPSAHPALDHPRYTAPPAVDIPAPGSLQERVFLESWKYVGDNAHYDNSGFRSRPTEGDPGRRDCSSLVWFIMQDVGFQEIYRNSDALIYWLDDHNEISRDEAVAGDLVIWHGHVGVYAGGNMLIDHGSGNGGAKYQKIHRGNPRFFRLPPVQA